MAGLRTDLAMEAFDGIGQSALPGVRVRHWEQEGVHATEVTISDNTSARALGKARGSYLTLESPLLRQRDPGARLIISAQLAQALERLLPAERTQQPILVVGLGNRAITPDALGPDTIDHILVTRHMLGGRHGPSNMRSVCALSPGVLGLTGIETMEIIESVAARVKPCAVICVDSLAARDTLRIGSTLQLSDAGIQPGAGVGNHRTPLTRETLGLPVLAIGMPTVVYAATLARDAFAWLSLQNGDDDPHEEALSDMEKALLGAEIGEMIVTPREIDALLQDASGMIASAINRALQPRLSDEEIAQMMI